jgi:periplasmic copper chaperone A
MAFMIDLSMPRWWRLVLAGALFFALVPLSSAGVFTVTEPWVRVLPYAKSAEGYMELRSSDGAKLVGVRSEVTADVAMLGPGAGRATVAEIPLPAGVLVKLSAGNFRFALAKLNRSLKLGDRVPMVIVIEAADGSRQEIDVSAEVRLHSPTDDHLHPHTHTH